MRAINQDEANGIKAAWRQGLDLAGGGKFENRTRVNGSALSKYGAPEHWDQPETVGKFAGIDIAVECDREARSPIITAAMAELLGYRLVPVAIEETGGAGGKVCIKDALILANEAGDAVREITLALDDGHMSAAEKVRVLKQLEELQRQTRSLIKRVGSAG